ncbi:28S ribosomal protein S18c, mitochondrial-like isoform X3 [Trachypithecus francoisi]|uniref:28S ribosomal protein S18c, mitochondrial-like isoform X3 n=1 Tax=Trachypithecus francoisi TaxID=54180 RepID=UPI00141AF02E|nr:28S ribosomal protein S18c, mitochondrial-like isoform X3 [Trachypithecus francoisi]
MATMVAVCSGLGRKKLTHLVMAAVSLTHPRTHMVLWRRGCLQYKQISTNEDLPIPMENSYKEALKKCILAGRGTKQVFVGRNRKKSQKQLRDLK